MVEDFKKLKKKGNDRKEKINIIKLKSNTKITKPNKDLLTDDLNFKNVFSDIEIAKYVIDLFFKFIGINRVYNLKLVTEQSTITSDNRMYKIYIGDLIYELDNGEIVNLEMYSNKFGKKDFNKSFVYMNRIYSNQMLKGNNNYQELKHVYSINFMRGNYRGISDEIVNVVNFHNEKHNKPYDDGNETMYLVRIDLSEEMLYTESEDEFITLLRMLNGKSMEEIEYYARKEGKGKAMRRKIFEKLKKWVNKERPMTIEEYVEEKARDARYDWLQEGKKVGQKVGATKANLKTAKNMLAKNYDINEISAITGLSVKKIMNLVN